MADIGASMIMNTMLWDICDHVYVNVIKRTTVQRRSHEVSIRVAIDVEAPNVLMKNLYNVYISP